MALLTCPECKGPVSNSASSCPKCGWKRPASPIVKVVVLLIVLLVAGFGTKLLIDKLARDDAKMM